MKGLAISKSVKKTLIKKENKMHPCEPSIDEVKKMYREMMSSKSTDDNIKKISALEKQIKRMEAEGAPRVRQEKSEEKPVEKSEK